MLNLAPFLTNATTDLVLQPMHDRNAMLGALMHLRTELEERMDVEDGPEGEPRPDWAMQLFQVADDALRTAGVR